MRSAETEDTIIVETTPENNCRVIPDGGEENDNNGNDGNNGNDDNNGNENDEEGTTILYLDIGDGHFLDLLGLEVDLEEVELDISAMPGSGNLLGNLLSAVAGLLDDGLSGLLSDLLPGEGLPSLSDLLPNPEDMSEMFFTVLNQVLDVLLEALGETESDESSG